MKIQIKKALLEGHTPEVIVEAVHANDPRLDKSKLKNPKTSYIDGKDIEKYRKYIAGNVSDNLKYRNNARKNGDHLKANYHDNLARGISQTGRTSTMGVLHHPGGVKELENFSGRNKSYRGDNNVTNKNDPMGSIISSNPRLISSAK